MLLSDKIENGMRPCDKLPVHIKGTKGSPANPTEPQQFVNARNL